MSTKKHTDLSALDIIEQAFYLLRKMGVNGLFFYYMGTMPFILGLLYYFNDMSKNAFAHEYCLTASLGMAGLFVWMKTWQAVYSIKTHAYLGGYRLASFSFQKIITLTITQTVIHATALIVLPVAFIVTIPFAWCFAMYQMVLVHDLSSPNGIRARMKESFNAATHYTFLNHMILFIFSGFGPFVFFNIAVTIYSAPFLIKSLLGYESTFTMGGFNMFNTTFLLSAACITHLCIDPLIKIMYVIQKYNFNVQKTGDDLISGVNAVQSENEKAGFKKTALISVVALFFILPSTPCRAMENPAKKIDTQIISAQALEDAIQEVTSKREYTWRMPRQEIKQKERTGFFYTVLKWTATQIKKAGEALADWIEKVYKWLKELFGKDEKPLEAEKPQSTVKPGHLALGLIILIVILLFAVILHLKKFTRKKENTKKKEKTPMPDIRDENTMADELASDQWLALAKDLVEKGEFRLAIRALYLSTLAQLADHHFIRIAAHKSNRDYLEELSLKAQAKNHLMNDLSGLVRTIDQVWYGMHTVNREIYDDFLSTRKRMMQFAEK